MSELRAHIGSDMPAYMIPSHFVKLDKIPLTANGKIDRKALPKPEGGLDSGTAYVAPRTELEAELAQIWQEVLGCGQVGVLDDFFALGGHSLKAMSLITAMHKAYEVEVPLKVLFDAPIVEAIAAYIQSAVKEAYVSIGQGCRMNRSIILYHQLKSGCTFSASLKAKVPDTTCQRLSYLKAS